MILDADTDKCYFSKHLIERQEGLEIVARVMDYGVNVGLLDYTNDIWARDYMPVQIEVDKFVGYEYTPDYLNNNQYSQLMSCQKRICDGMKIPTLQSGLVLDGGNVVKTNRGIIMVDKVFKENHNIPKIEVINCLEKLFQAELILLPWDKFEIFGHADGIAREIEPGKILMTDYRRYSKRFAYEFEKVLSCHFEVEQLEFKVSKPHDLSWCYINFLRVKNKIFLPQLTLMERETYSQACGASGGSLSYPYRTIGKEVEEDYLAIEKFRKLYPTCEIIPVSCPKIVQEGGALNCISWNIKIPADKPSF